jgi:hypothetical protein
MFDAPQGREKPTLLRPLASGYTRFTGVGILMSTLKLSSAITVAVAGEGDNVGMKADVTALVTATFKKAVSLAMVNEVGDEAEHPVKKLYGDRQPYTEEHWSTVHRRHGMRELPDGSWEKLDAAIHEEYSIHAPITRDIQGFQKTDVGLGKDKDGKAVETEAPITETIHGKAPITRDIRSPQTITVGIGNGESGDAGEQRHAPIKMTLGDDADIDFRTGSGIVAEVEKSVDVTVVEDVSVAIGGNKDQGVEGNRTESVGGNLEENVTGNAKYTSANTDIKSTAPVGINDGLYITGLSPYLTAETAAATALSQAATQAIPPLAILDAISGGTGFVTALGTAIAAYCAAMQAADTAAHTSIAKAVK